MHLSKAPKRKFKADFIRYMRECEYNYRRMLKLLPSLDVRKHWGYLLDDADTHLALCISMEVRTPYTDTLRISWQCNAQTQAWLPATDILVRLYHDVQTAEVLNDVSYQPMYGDYTYPNTHMYQRDEKLQRNAFLGSFLQHCLEFAYVDDNVVDKLLHS